MLHVENMLRLESGAIQELVGKMMLVAMMDRLVDLDVSNFTFSCEIMVEKHLFFFVFCF